jgi:hypothetical protein
VLANNDSGRRPTLNMYSWLTDEYKASVNPSWMSLAILGVMAKFSWIAS